MSPDLLLKNVLYSPQFSCNLISIRQLTKDLKCRVTYGEQSCVIQDRTSKRLIRAGDMRNRVYCLKNSINGASFVATRKEGASLWHRRLGHPSYGSLATLSKLCDF